jgi:hypothetical protein
MTILEEFEFAPNRATVGQRNFAELERRIQGYTHTQSVPASTWNVAHNLGYRPTAFSLWIDDAVHHAVVEYVDDDHLQVKLQANKTGLFKCS